MLSKLYDGVFNSLRDGIYFVDTERRITFWNKGAERITGFAAEEVLNTFCFENLLNHVDSEGNKLCHGGCPLHQTIQDQKPRSTLVYLHHKKGHRVPVQVQTLPLYDDQEQLVGCIEIFSDESHEFGHDLSREELQAIAFTDALTGIPNRRYAESQLRKAHTSLVEDGTPYAIALIDIDHFKKVNDTYGHDLGDEVLKIVASTLAGSTRSVDCATRWGGEEFLLVLPGITEELFRALLERIRMLVETSVYRSPEHTLSVTISIGGVLATKEDTTPSLIKQADQLLYQAKEQGRNRVMVG